jgi:hypothetical protein
MGKETAGGIGVVSAKTKERLPKGVCHMAPEELWHVFWQKYRDPFLFLGAIACVILGVVLTAVWKNPIVGDVQFGDFVFSEYWWRMTLTVMSSLICILFVVGTFALQWSEEKKKWVVCTGCGEIRNRKKVQAFAQHDDLCTKCHCTVCKLWRPGVVG